MSEEDLRRALIGQGAGRGAASGEIAARVIRRDRWIVSILAVGTVMLWAIAAAGILCFNVAFVTFVVPSMKDSAVRGRWDRLSYVALRFIHDWGSPLLNVAACALILAAIGTVGLILFSRRASLRQINQSLAMISDQLRELSGGSRP